MTEQEYQRLMARWRRTAKREIWTGALITLASLALLVALFINHPIFALIPFMGMTVGVIMTIGGIRCYELGNRYATALL